MKDQVIYETLDEITSMEEFVIFNFENLESVL